MNLRGEDTSLLIHAVSEALNLRNCLSADDIVGMLRESGLATTLPFSLRNATWVADEVSVVAELVTGAPSKSGGVADILDESPNRLFIARDSIARKKAMDRVYVVMEVTSGQDAAALMSTWIKRSSSPSVGLATMRDGRRVIYTQLKAYAVA